MVHISAIRPHSLVEMEGSEAIPENGWSIRRARGATFLVELADARPGATALQRTFDDEAILLLPFIAGEVTVGGVQTEAPERSIVVLPAGNSEITLKGEGRAILLSPIRDNAPETLNDTDYAGGTAGIRPAGQPAERTGGADVQVINVDAIVPPAGKPRLRMVRSSSMSINWIEYEGVRDRSNLSPHSHDDFEQGSLAIEGAFLHHLRVPWGPDANAWRDDAHLEAPKGSLCIIPPRVIHTTEGLGEGKHILIDVFAPARPDFVAAGWISNQALYRD